MPEPLVPLISLNGHPIKDAALWPVVASTYQTATAYPVDSHVIYENQLYRCIHAIDSVGEAWNAEHWQLTDIDTELRRGLQHGIDALHVIATEYNASNAYFVGAYTMKDGVFYQCIVDIPNGEDWDPTHWVSVTVAAEMREQQNKLEDLGENVAEEYDASHAYPKNSYMRKDGKMYRALVDIAGLELWDASKWEECTVGSELGQSRTTDKFTQDSIAPEFNPNRTYVAGDLVMYNGKLYRCLTTVPVPEPWNATRWGLTSVANEVNLSDISSIFGFYIDEDGYLAQNITSDGFDPSTVNIDEVLGFYISVDGYISQKVSV